MNRRGLISALFICTGASGLVFEILWVKQLGLLVSSTTFALSLTVSVFLGGLMLGAELAGRLSLGITRPLRAYALTELAAGVLAAGVTLLLPKLPDLAEGLGVPGGGPLAVRALLVALVLLPPTLAMGATLPLLSRYVAHDDARVGRDIGTLYSLNTLGAAAGCALGGFIAVSLLGVKGAALAAAAVNFAVGLTAFLLSRDEPALAAGSPAQPGAGRATWLEPFFFVSGFAAIAYEVLWFRVVAIYFDASTYAFTVLLSTFLLGLVIGGALYVRRWSNHPRPLELLTGLQSGIALLGLIAFAIIGLSQGLAHLTQGLARGQWGFVLAMWLHALVVILPPAVLIGAVFPLVVRLGTERAAEAGSRVGRLYAVNTLGGIIASLLFGFVLIPLIGTQVSYAIACLLSMALAVFAQSRDAAAPRRARVQLYAVSGLVALGLVMPPRDFWTYSQVATPDAKILSLREGRDGTLAVLEYTRDSVCDSKLYRCDAKCPQFSHRKLTFGAISYASSILPARRYMRFQAHIAMMLRPEASDVLEVCFGTGTTAGAFVSHPQLKSLDLVDLNPDVFAQAPLFVDVNHDPFGDPRVHRTVDDGRHFLLATDKKFDVVSFEPPPPVAHGVVNLYSRDFYELVKRRMKKGGVVTQWIPFDQQSSRLGRALTKSMSDVFRHVALYIPSRLHGIAVASDEPLPEDLADWARQYESPTVRASLEDIGFMNPLQLQAVYFAADEALAKWTGDVPAVTDDRPAIEHFLFEWDKPFDITEVLAVRPHREGPAWEAERLRALAAWAARSAQFETARELNAKADALLPGNGYGRFLRDIEYGCLEPK
ncbi:MAG: fused MFS/spermidine synthase [Myxococcaceae bacterium]|nr:fused MFS/spermidine synthase [Myxococcaceae bacterium]